MMFACSSWRLVLVLVLGVGSAFGLVEDARGQTVPLTQADLQATRVVGVRVGVVEAAEVQTFSRGFEDFSVLVPEVFADVLVRPRAKVFGSVSIARVASARTPGPRPTPDDPVGDLGVTRSEVDIGSVTVGMRLMGDPGPGWTTAFTVGLGFGLVQGDNAGTRGTGLEWAAGNDGTRIRPRHVNVIWGFHARRATPAAMLQLDALAQALFDTGNDGSAEWLITATLFGGGGVRLVRDLWLLGELGTRAWVASENDLGAFEDRFMPVARAGLRLDRPTFVLGFRVDYPFGVFARAHAMWGIGGDVAVRF